MCRYICRALLCPAEGCNPIDRCCEHRTSASQWDVHRYVQDVDDTIASLDAEELAREVCPIAGEVVLNAIRMPH